MFNAKAAWEKIRAAEDQNLVSDFFFGLDLGQASDPSAMIMIRRRPILDGTGKAILRDHRGRRVFTYKGGHIERFSLLTPYPEIVRQVTELVNRPEVSPMPYLAIDATGVGRPVVDMFLNAPIKAHIYPVTITAGYSDARRDAWGLTRHMGYWVTKSDIVGAVQSALSGGRIKLPSPKVYPLSGILKKELANFKVKISQAGNDIFGAWRDGQHDDIVLALAIALWLGDELDYRYLGLTGSVEVPREVESRVHGSITSIPSDPTAQWNRTGIHSDALRQLRAQNNYGLGDARRTNAQSRSFLRRTR